MTDRLRTLIDALVDSLDEPASGEELARRVHLSRFHFDRLVAAATGESPGTFRRRLLLERAAHALRGESTVLVAALDAGYSSAEAFTRAFRRAYGVPPSAHPVTAACRRRMASTSIRRAACSCPGTKGETRWT